MSLIEGFNFRLSTKENFASDSGILTGWDDTVNNRSFTIEQGAPFVDEELNGFPVVRFSGGESISFQSDGDRRPDGGNFTYQ
jgi:hypothetical protein